MMDSTILREGLIAALATPLGQSALAVIRTSGPDCIAAVAGVFSRPDTLLASAGHQMVHGWLRDPRDGREVDEVMLGVFRNPRSYTGEDMVEIYAHGSVPGIDRVLALLFSRGFRQAEGGEFTLRAFLNGKLDLTRAEAVQEIVSARSRTAQSLALNRLGGAVYQRMDQIKQVLVRQLAAVSLQLDYPEDEVEELDYPMAELAGLIGQLESLASTYRLGRLYQNGIRLALAGRTNAGKSSLFNALVREERAIVSGLHGTTRDYLEAPFNLKGLPVRLFDTAGLREVEEVIEAEGIRRSGQVIGSSALALYLVDASEDLGLSGSSLHPDDQGHIAGILESGIGVLVVWNKTDAPGSRPVPAGGTISLRLESGETRSVAVVGVSALTLDGLEGLLDAVAERVLDGASAEDGQVLIDSERQFRLLERSAASLRNVAASLEAGVSLDLVALDLQDAVAALGEITGEVTSEDILTSMFSNFCVGK